MISMNTALQLKTAGLEWQPAIHDFFAIPDVDMDDKVFVLADMMAEMTVLKGWPAITFNGVVEWALDYVLQMDVVWLPREDQLRTALESYSSLIELKIENGYSCTVEWDGGLQIFTAGTAADAYAAALIFFLEKNSS